MRRLFDAVGAAFGLVVTSPILLVAGVAIRLESRGPVIYRQRRVGKDGEPFELWKLRTMVSGAETMGHGIYVLEGDARITRVGRQHPCRRVRRSAREHVSRKPCDRKMQPEAQAREAQV